MLRINAEHTTTLIKQTLINKNCLSKNTLCEADIRLENFQKNIHTTYQQQNLNRGIRAIKNPSTMKNTKMIGNYLMNSGKPKL